MQGLSCNETGKRTKSCLAHPDRQSMKKRYILTQDKIFHNEDIERYYYYYHKIYQRGFNNILKFFDKPRKMET